MDNPRRVKQVNETIVGLQNELVSITNELHEQGSICFRSVEAKGSGGGFYWKPVENLPGDFIVAKYKEKPDWVVETSRRVSDDYQKVITQYFHRHPEAVSDQLSVGSQWIFGKLFMWGGSIVSEGLMEKNEIIDLFHDFEALVTEKGGDVFGHCHGNVIGDHIYVGEDGQLYLFGMRIVIRPGQGYYDYLRALDWLFLKTDGEMENEARVKECLTELVAQRDEKEVRVVFALRCLGILGWDMLERGDFGMGDSDKKKEILLRFIRRDY